MLLIAGLEEASVQLGSRMDFRGGKNQQLEVCGVSDTFLAGCSYIAMHNSIVQLWNISTCLLVRPHPQLNFIDLMPFMVYVPYL